MLITLHPDNPQPRQLDAIAADLKRGEIYILPTDTVYAFATLLGEKRSIEQLYQLKEISPTKPLSLYCRDFSQAADYIRMSDNRIFRWMKKHLPGPYTLVFVASKNMPQYTVSKKKMVGVRIIDHPVIQGLLERLDQPIIGTSVYSEGEYFTYAEDLEENYGKRVKGVVDTGPLEQEFSTVLDMSDFPPEVIREGKGPIGDLF